MRRLFMIFQYFQLLLIPSFGVKFNFHIFSNVINYNYKCRYLSYIALFFLSTASKPKQNAFGEKKAAITQSQNREMIPINEGFSHEGKAWTETDVFPLSAAASNPRDNTELRRESNRNKSKNVRLVKFSRQLRSNLQRNKGIIFYKT